MKQTFDFQNGASASIQPNDKGVPVMYLNNVPGIPGVLSYYASSWVEAASLGREFRMTGGYADDPVVSISPEEVRHVASWVRQYVVDRKLGVFETVFVVNDPRVPF